MKLTRRVLREIEVAATKEAKRVDCHGDASTFESRVYLSLARIADLLDSMLAEKELAQFAFEK